MLNLLSNAVFGVKPVDLFNLLCYWNASYSYSSRCSSLRLWKHWNSLPHYIWKKVMSLPLIFWYGC